jgi:DNA-binding CsgD family transcriptional regulator
MIMLRDQTRQRGGRRGHRRRPGYRLTAREAKTMTLVLRGLPTKTIAKTLRVTMNTANDHIKAIFAKTGVSSRRRANGHGIPRSQRAEVLRTLPTPADLSDRSFVRCDGGGHTGDRRLGALGGYVPVRDLIMVHAGAARSRAW